MKILIDFLPLVFFFTTFKYAENHAQWAADWTTQHLGFLVSGGVVQAKEAPILLATVAVILSTALLIMGMKLARKKVDTMLWVNLGIITVLGGLTIWLHSETFIKWKPTLLYWVMGLGIVISDKLMGKNILKTMIGKELELPASGWSTLAWMWGGFFAFMGLLNLYIAYNYPTDTWVNFKVFGSLGLMVVFVIAQSVYINRLSSPVAPQEARGDAQQQGDDA